MTGDRIYVADKETLDKIYDIVSGGDCYGFIEHDITLSAPHRIEAIGINKDYTPLTVDKTLHTYSLGSWSTFPIITENKPWMVKANGAPDYQLSETDYTKKKDGVTASDVANASYAGGAFSKLIKIYRKQDYVGNDRIVLFSFKEKEGFTADGFKGRPYRWIPMFYGSVDGDGKAQCIAGTQPSANITTDAQHTALTNFSAEADFFGGPIVEMIIDLLMMMTGTSDLCGALGDGNNNGYDASDPYKGVLPNAVVGGGQFYGSSDGRSLNKIFHSIVLGSYQQWMRDPYEVVANGFVKVSKDYNYDPTGATYEDTGIRVSDRASAGWHYPLVYLPVEGYGSMPDASSGEGSTSTGPCDGTYIPASPSGMVAVALRFGNCYYGAPGGLRARDWSNTASHTHWGIGFAAFL